MNVWGASPVNQTHTIKLVISQGNKWAVAACLLTGLIVGFVLGVLPTSWIDDRRVEAKIFEHRQRVFHLVEIKEAN